MKKLSTASRIIVAIVSLSLIAAYFLPIWRIDLFAPQYPEGLTMRIWLNTITGEIDVINGLNHYIGMRHIKPEMFPEFEFLIYVVGFYILLGLAIAIVGRRNLLFWYLVFTAFGGLFAMYDFYRWGYEYGHNLDETAPIKVPGLSYQPPLLGHKRLLNFDAYSFPDIGGWIIIIAAGIAFLVWFYEWYKKHKKKPKPAGGVVMGLIVMTLVSCSAKPEPFKLGTDVCYTCKMGIADVKFGGELLTRKGKVYKFDDIGCMIRYLKSGAIEQKEIEQTVVVNYEKKDDFINVNMAVLIASPLTRSPMGFNLAAFSNESAAKKHIEGTAGKVFTWTELYQQVE